jgi:hypothetical protein
MTDEVEPVNIQSVVDEIKESVGEQVSKLKVKFKVNVVVGQASTCELYLNRIWHGVEQIVSIRQLAPVQND